MAADFPGAITDLAATPASGTPLDASGGVLALEFTPDTYPYA